MKTIRVEHLEMGKQGVVVEEVFASGHFSGNGKHSVDLQKKWTVVFDDGSMASFPVDMLRVIEDG